jgi:hypothetical protein
MIAAIVPEHRFLEYGCEPALTLVPNILISGFCYPDSNSVWFFSDMHSGG